LPRYTCCISKRRCKYILSFFSCNILKQLFYISHS